MRIKRAGQVTACFHLWPGLPWVVECAADQWGCWWSGDQCITWPLVSLAGQQTDVSLSRLGIDRLTSGGRRAPGQRVLSNITGINDINDHWENMWCIYDPPLASELHPLSLVTLKPFSQQSTHPFRVHRWPYMWLISNHLSLVKQETHFQSVIVSQTGDCRCKNKSLWLLIWMGAFYVEHVEHTRNVFKAIWATRVATLLIYSEVVLVRNLLRSSLIVVF